MAKEENEKHEAALNARIKRHEKKRFGRGPTIAPMIGEFTKIQSCLVPSVPKFQPFEMVQKESRPCRYFLKGSCLRGENCRFMHQAPVRGIEIQVCPPQIDSNALIEFIEREFGVKILHNPKVNSYGHLRLFLDRKHHKQNEALGQQRSLTFQGVELPYRRIDKRPIIRGKIVFINGIPNDMSTYELIEFFSELHCHITGLEMRHHLVKDGRFPAKAQFANEKQVQKLIRLSPINLPNERGMLVIKHYIAKS